LLFDDYNWTYGTSGRDATDGITSRSLSESDSKLMLRGRASE